MIKVYKMSLEAPLRSDIRVIAENKAEAKQKAFELFKYVCKKKDFKISAEEIKNKL